MLRVTVLGSGSRGNAILVEGSGGALMLDAGFGTRALTKRLATTGRRPEDVSALLLTHEHTDHACGALAACAKWAWPLHATPGTLAALSVDVANSEECPAIVSQAPVIVGGSCTIGDWTVDTFAVPHDARECAAYVLTDQRTGARLGVALDLGHAPAGLPAFLADVDLLVVESNHDEGLLAAGPYPWMLKRRIGGRLGHLANGEAASLAAACAHQGLQGVILAHLSETNNTPEHALTRTRNALRRSGWRRDTLWVATQGTPLGPIGLSGRTSARAPVQLALGL